MTRRIDIRAVPQEWQRYDTAGDWYVDGDTLDIAVTGTDLSDDQTFLIALHELVEAHLCRKRGITAEAVDAFDKAWIAAHPGYLDGTEGEPGDDPAAPYRREHRQAMLVEHLVADMLGIAGYGRVE